MAEPAGGGDAVGVGIERDGLVLDADTGGAAGAGAAADGEALPDDPDEPLVDAVPDLFTPP